MDDEGKSRKTATGKSDDEYDDAQAQPSKTSMSSSASSAKIGGVAPLHLGSANMPLTWKNWLTQLKIYMRANMLEDASNARKVAILLHLIGSDALSIFYSFDLDIDTVTFEVLVERFNAYFLPRVNITMERHRLFNRRQGLDEPIDSYVTDLKNISSQCEFGDLQDSILRDIFSWNLNSSNQYLRERILMESPKKFDETVALAKHHETSRHQAMLLEQNTSFIGQLQAKPQNKGVYNPVKKFPVPAGAARQKTADIDLQHPECGRCGQIHRFRCPANGVRCNKCNRLNHFSIVCRNKNVRIIESDNNKAGPSDEQEQLFLGTVACDSLGGNSWRTNMSINNKNIVFLIDTGADTNILSYKTFKRLEIPCEVSKSTSRLLTFSGENIPTVGQSKLNVRHKNNEYEVNFHIVDLDCQNIIGRDTCKTLNLVKLINCVDFGLGPSHDLIEGNQDLFQGLGCIKDFECNLTLKPDIPPTIDACRRVPFQLQQPLKDELEEMERTGVICKVDEPTEWVSSIVLTTKKNGKLRLCIDPRKLNKAVMRPHYQFPTLDEIKSDLSEAKYFTTLDANKGFWMLKLSESASKLCTFITPFGRYRFTRLPFGINAAPELFHREMVRRFGDLKGVKIMMDDFLIYGSTITEHNENLKRVLERAREINLRFNKEKSVFCQQSVKFLGHIFSHDGVRVDPSKVEAICQMVSPKSVPELQRFMGMVNYLSPFLENLSQETSHLRSLLSKDTAWVWSDQHEAEFNKIKKMISSAPVLTYYSPNKDVILSVDASKDAMGAVLSHEKQPIAFASASLSKSQQNYSQIEKELLAVLFGCSKFHQYIYGRQITVETDHKPLISLFTKALYDIPPRLQRIMLRLQPYDLEVIYKPGKYLYIADTLSRSALPDLALTDLDNDLDMHINLIMSSLAASKQKLDEIRQNTLSDAVLTQIVAYCENGWPEHKRSVNSLIQPYFPLKDQIHVIDNIVFKSQSIIIPQSMRKDILVTLHQGHQGINSCTRLARNSVYWPNINRDIEKFVNQCHVCLTYRRDNTKEPIIHHDYKLLPWTKVGMDIFEFENIKYLLVVDYFSKYIELALLKSGTSADHVIAHLKSIFARHGIPVTAISDNGPPFSSVAFQNFMKDWGIEHITSSPYISRSNGMAERAIGTVKNMLKKCKLDGSDPYIALLQYRNTPKRTGFSPSQLSMSRNLRTLLPSCDEQLLPALVDYNVLKANIEKDKSYSTLYYNRLSKSLTQLNTGDKVYFKHKVQGEWVPGVVSNTCSEPRSYIVQSPLGSYRRNREHILKPSCSNLPDDNKNMSNTRTDGNVPIENPGDVRGGVESLITTRSGRIIRKPARYCD